MSGHTRPERHRLGADRRRTAVLGLLCAVPPMVEVAIVSRFSVPRTVAFAPQISAMPPFGSFHDLRWVAVFHRSWLQFAVGTTAALLYRSSFITAVIRVVRGDRDDAPPLLVTWRRALAGTAVLFLVLTLPTLLLFASEVVSLSWIVLAGIGTFLTVAVLSYHAPVASSWWRRLPSACGVRWLLLSAVVLTAAGAVLSIVPTGAGIALAGLVGAFNAIAWWRVVQAASQPVDVVRRVPVGAVALVGAVGLMALFTWVGFRLFPTAEASNAAAAPHTAPAVDGRHPVIDIRGFASSYDGQPAIDLGPDYDVVRFSYRGSDAMGNPLPYDSADTDQSVEVSVRKLAAQVAALHRATGDSVRIVATSEGTVIARVFVAGTPSPPISDLLLLSPLVWPDRVSYPPPGDPGWGVATGYGLRGLGWLVTSLSDYRVGPDLPFVRSMLDHADALEFGIMCPQPGLRERAIVPVAESVAGFLPESQHVPLRVVGGFHGTAVGPDEVRQELTAMLHGADMSASSGLWAWVNRVVSASAAAWQAPHLSFVDTSAPPDGALSDRCERSQDALSRWARAILNGTG